MNPRQRDVAVAVIFDPPSQGFLLCHNKRWNGYAFPMQHFEPRTESQPAKIALQALDDWYVPLTLSNPSATPLDHVVKTLYSEAARELTVYEYHVFDVLLTVLSL